MGRCFPRSIVTTGACNRRHYARLGLLLSGRRTSCWNAKAPQQGDGLQGPWPGGRALHSRFTLNDSAVIGEVSRTVDPVRKRGGPVGDDEDGDVSALTIEAFQQRGRRCVPKRYSKERTGEWGLE